MRPSRTAQKGFSLVELMVALVLGIILTSGVISVYITSKNTYNVNTAIGAVQEHGRYAFSFMYPDIRMAGYSGCRYLAPADHISPTYTTTEPFYGYAASIYSSVYGFEASGTGVNGSLNISTTPTIDTTPPQDPTLWSPALDTGASAFYTQIKSTALKGSDIFMVKELQQNPPLITAASTGNTLTVSTSDNGVNDTSYFAAGTIAMVSNCTGSVDVFQVASVDAGAGTITSGASPALTSIYGPNSTDGAVVGTFQTYAYYVGKGTDPATPSLYRATLKSDGSITTQELVSGIENMQVLYGVNDAVANDPPKGFYPADTVTANGDWKNVVSIRVGLIAESDDNSTDKTATSSPYFYMLASDPAANANSDGMKITLPKDRRLRRYFAQTFSVRNALP